VGGGAEGGGVRGGGNTIAAHFDRAHADWGQGAGGDEGGLAAQKRGAELLVVGG